MKKALSVFLMIAVAFGAFADEPVADVNVAEFSGNAAVQWGVDLDSGTTGFQNSYEVNLKLNLLNNGSKSTTGDGVWGELVLKVDGDTYAQWQNKTHGDKAFAPTKGMAGETTGGSLTAFFKKVYVDVAKIHIGPAYIGIKSGDTQTGKLKMDAAIRSADDDQSVWVQNVGPADYSQGIVLGYDSDMFKVDLDLRSKPATKNPAKRVVAYVLDKDGKIKTGALAEGDVIHYFDGSTYTATKDDAGKTATSGQLNELGGATPNDYYYTDNYAAALEGEFKGVENLSIKAGASYNFAKNYQAKKADKDKTAIGDPEHILGYSASAGYKLGLNDTFFLRPQLGFTGTTKWLTTEDGNTKTETTAIGTTMAAGLLFGWGEIGQDKNAGVWYLDDDMAKKVSPGVGVVAYIPFAGKSDVKTTVGGSTSTASNKIHGRYSARIMPSFYSGELIPGLTAAAYGDILIMDEDGAAKTGTTRTSNTDAAMAFAVGAQYALPVGEMTITPKLGLRFANASYADNYSSFGEKDDGVFGKDSAVDMGAQTVKVDDTATTDVNEAGWYDGNFMNMKLGVDVGGLVDNTTLSVIWETANLLNKSEADKAPKLGTLNFKAKISL